jgi:hypothetical protein
MREEQEQLAANTHEYEKEAMSVCIENFQIRIIFSGPLFNPLNLFPACTLFKTYTRLTSDEQLSYLRPYLTTSDLRHQPA